jgi:hypothetical protein
MNTPSAIEAPAEVQREVPEWEEVDASAVTRPERFIGLQANAFAIPSLHQTKDGLKPAWHWYLETAGGQRCRRPLESKLQVEGEEYYVNPAPPESTTDPPAWSKTSRVAWLRGQPEPNPRGLFENVFAGFANYLEVDSNAEGLLATLALWVMTGYFYHGLNAVPYLNLCGPAGSGKTRVLELLRALTFKPILSSNLTAPSLFRSLHANGGVLLLDEGERLADKTPDAAEIRSCLLAGYRAGGRVTRLEPVGKTFKAVEFSCFGPKALAAIASLPPALRSRCIAISMFRAPAGSLKVRKRIDDERERFANTRDDLYRAALAYSHQWLAAIHGTSQRMPSMSGRDVELWLPIVGLANWFDARGCEGLGGLLEQYALAAVEASSDEVAPDADLVLLATLAAAVRCGELVTPADLLARVREREPSLFTCWTSRGVANRLRSYSLVTVKSNGRRVYRATVDDLARIGERYKLDLEGEE